jgi:hypothetical protein
MLISMDASYPKGSSQVLGIVLHWSVSGYTNTFTDYHICIIGDGTPVITTPIFINGQWNNAAHLWHRNTGHIGVSVMAMVGAKEPTNWNPPDIYTFPPEYGFCPPTKAQIDTLCQVSAQLADYFNLGPDNITTHYDWAVVDDYTDERWDFKFEGPLLKSHIKSLRSA